MPPTIQTGPREDRERKGGRGGTGDKRSDLVCKMKYNNTLPDIPFDPKFITYPFESNRFIQYNPTSLERSYKYDLLTEHDLGVTIDLINPDTYKINPNDYPDPEDARLLDEDSATNQDARRSRHHNTNVSWLRKTEYISTEYNRFIQKNDMSETKVGFKMKQYMKEEELYKDRDNQIQAIEATFEAAQEEITKHYSKPGVTPVEVLPVLPDFEMWKHPFAQVIFDSDPAPKGRSLPAQLEEMSRAMIRGAVDESGEHFVAYFLPSEETIKKRKRDMEDEVEYDPEEEYEYVLSREYNWNVKNKLSKGYEETYFFVFRPDGVYFNELETRVRLSRRRKVGKDTHTQMAKSRLFVKHRDIEDKELNAQSARLMVLEPPQEEEDDDTRGDDLSDLHSPRAGSDDEGRKSDHEGSVRSGRSSASSRSSRSRKRSHSGSRSGSSSRSGSVRGSGSEKGSGSESEAESEAGKKDEEEIFGSASSSDSD